jgi:hypothetical protein
MALWLGDTMGKLLTITEFCSYARISRSLYYALKRRRKGPAETHIGTRVLIAEETARKWLKRLERAA